MRKLLQTRPDPMLLFLRVVLGVVFFPHAAQKVLGWFGGAGLQGTLDAFTGNLGLAPAVVWLVIAAEFLGSLGLVFGLLGRIAAFGIACDMVGAIALVHAPNGFFMNWYGNQSGEGYEYHLLVLALAVVVMIRGSGLLSVDRALTRGSGETGAQEADREVQAA